MPAAVGNNGVAPHSPSTHLATGGNGDVQPHLTQPDSSTPVSLPSWLTTLPQVLQARLFTATNGTVHTADPTSFPPTVQAMIQGAQYMAGVVSNNFGRATLRGQTVGPEIEVFANVSRTEMARAIAARYQAAGFQTREVVSPNYTFSDDPSGFWETAISSEVDGKPLTFHLYEGVGGFVVTAKSHMDIRSDILQTGDESLVLDKGVELAAEMFGMPVDTIRAAVQNGQQWYLMAVKSVDKDYFEVKVEMHPKSGTATLTGLTGQFVGTDGNLVRSQEIQAKDLPAVKDYLLNTLKGGVAAKDDPMTTIEVDVPGRHEPLTVDVRYDVYPIKEIVLSPMAAGETDALMGPVSGFLERPNADGSSSVRLEGTGRSNQVGFQVHREVQWLDGKGSPTVEYLLNLHREWISVASKLAQVIPTLEARRLFARALPEAVAAEIMDPQFVTDPTNVAQAFDYFGLIARTTAPKYHDMNVENWVGHHVDVLLQKGIIQPGQVIESVRYPGTTYMVGQGQVVMQYQDGGNTRSMDLVRIHTPTHFPTIELRTPDTHEDASYMRFLMRFMAGFGHDVVGTGTADVKALHAASQEPGMETVARDFEIHPALPISIMTLLGVGTPELLVAHRLKGLTGEASIQAMAPYHTLLANTQLATQVDNIVRAVRTGGLAAVMGPDVHRDPIAQALNTLVNAGANAAKLIEGIYTESLVPPQSLGAEVEFNPSVSRDTLYQILADAYQLIPGVKVELVTGQQYFNFNAKSPHHWTISQPLTVNGVPMTAKVASGTGGFIISAIRSMDDAITRTAQAADPLAALKEAIGMATEFTGAGHSISAGAPQHLMMFKASDNDYFTMEVEFNDGSATLHALNGQFNGPSGLARSVSIPAHSLKDVERFLEDNAGPKFALKDNTIARMEATYPGHTKPFVITFVDEEHPNQEAVTGRMNARFTEVIEPYLNALSGKTIDAAGQTVDLVDGVRSGNPLAVHVHAQLQHLDAAGNLTIAAFLQLQRNFGVLADDFATLLGPDANRTNFAKKAPDAYLQRIADTNYAPQPTELHTILNVFGDYVAARAPKYQDFSAEHFVSWFCRTLINESKLSMGQTLTTEWHGQQVRFSVRPDADGSAQIYRGVSTEAGFTAEQPMIRLSAHQPTAELRLPNAIFAPEGRTADFVGWLLKLTTSFVQTHAQIDSQTIAPIATQRVGDIAKLITTTTDTTTAVLPLAKPTVAQPPAGQAGLANVDIMSFGGIRAFEAMMDVYNAIPTPAKQVAANTARGGATMYLGQMGADVIDAVRTGNWSRFQNIKPAAEARDIGALMAGSQVGQVLTTAAVTPIPTSIMPLPLKGIAVRAGSLAAGVTLLNALRTGELHLEELPKTIGVTLAATGAVRTVTTILSRSKTAVAAAEMFKLSHAGRATFLGAVFTSVAEFTVMREIQRKLFRDANQPNIDKVRDYATQLIQADIVIQQAREAGETVDPKIATAVRTQLKQLAQQVKAIPDIDEQIAIAEFEQNKLDLYNGKNLAISAGVQSGEADWNMTKELRRLERSHASRVASIRDDLGRQSVESLRTAEEFQPEDIADSGLPLPGDINGTSLESTKPRPIQGTLGNSWSTLALQLNDYIAQPSEAMVAMN